jgi:hypothetical protein
MSTKTNFLFKKLNFSHLFFQVLPLLWIIPWGFTKAYIDNYWCWQTASDWNLIIKIPHSILLVINMFCSFLIIKILYSKLNTPHEVDQSNLNKNK